MSYHPSGWTAILGYLRNFSYDLAMKQLELIATTWGITLED